MNAIEVFSIGVGESAPTEAGKAGSLKGGVKGSGLGAVFGPLMAALSKGTGDGNQDPQILARFQRTLTALREQASGETTKQALTELAALLEKTRIAKQAQITAAAVQEKPASTGVFDSRGPLSQALIQLLRKASEDMPDLPTTGDTVKLQAAVDAAMAAVQQAVQSDGPKPAPDLATGPAGAHESLRPTVPGTGLRAQVTAIDGQVGDALATGPGETEKSILATADETEFSPLDDPNAAAIGDGVGLPPPALDTPITGLGIAGKNNAEAFPTQKTPEQTSAALADGPAEFALQDSDETPDERGEIDGGLAEDEVDDALETSPLLNPLTASTASESAAASLRGSVGAAAAVRPDAVSRAPGVGAGDGLGGPAAGNGLTGDKGPADLSDARQGGAGQGGDGGARHNLPGGQKGLWPNSVTGHPGHAAAGPGPGGVAGSPGPADFLGRWAGLGGPGGAPGGLDHAAAGRATGQLAAGGYDYGTGTDAAEGDAYQRLFGRGFGGGGSPDGLAQGGFGAQPLLVDGQGQPVAAAFTALRGGRPPARAVPDQVSVQLRRGLQQGLDRLTIMLEPRELGRIDIRLEIGRDRQVRAHIAVDKSQTLELLQKDARGLERILQDAGFKTDGDSLSFSLKQQDHPADGGRRQSGGTSGRAGAETMTDPDTGSSEGSLPVMVMTSDRIDVRI